MLTATLTYSPSLVKKAVLGYLRRGLGTGGLACVAAVVTIDVVLVLGSPWTWLTGALTGATAVLALVLVGLYLAHYRQAVAKLGRMGVPQALLELTDTELRVSSNAGSFSAPWSSFADLWQFSEFWLLIIGPGQFMTLPLADLSPDLQAFLIARVRPRLP